MFRACSASLAGTAVSTLASSSFSSGLERVLLQAASAHQAEFVALMRALARGSIATRKIDALTAAAVGASNVIFVEVDQAGTRNTSYKSLAGGATTLCVPRQISWNAGGPAVLTAEIIFLSANGTTAPVTVGTTAGSTTAEADVWVGSGTGVSQIAIDFGLNVVIPPDGHLYPINAYISREHPTLSVVTNDPAQITQANAQPGAVTSLAAVFAKIADGGVRGATRTYTATGHVYAESVSDGEPGTVRLVCAAKGGLVVS